MNIVFQKGAVLLTASVLGALGNFFGYSAPVINPPPLRPVQIFIADSLPPASTTSAEQISASSTNAKIGDPAAIRFSLPEVKLKMPAQAKKTQKSEAPRTQSSVSPPSLAPVSAIPKPATKISTPQDLLDATSFSLAQRIDGSYVLTLRTNTGSGAGFDWGFSDETIGGTQSLPKMTASYFCVPQWNAPQMNAADKNPTFDIGSSYSCEISLADSLMRVASKKINFQTGGGRLLVRTSNLSTQLKSGSNYNGFIFENQSDARITVTGITFDASFRALNVSSPIVVRFVNPEAETSYEDFPMQNFAADSSKPDMKSGAGMRVGFSFSINPRSQRMLRVEILGVQQLLTVGVSPEFNVALRQINITNDGIKTVLFSPAISWNCIPFDPAKSLDGIPTEQNCR